MSAEIFSCLCLFVANIVIVIVAIHRIYALNDRVADLDMEIIKLTADIKSTQDLVYRTQRPREYMGQMVTNDCSLAQKPIVKCEVEE